MKRVEAEMAEANVGPSQGGVDAERESAPPREGLPPCALREARFDGRAAILWGASACSDALHQAALMEYSEYTVQQGTYSKSREWEWHGGLVVPYLDAPRRTTIASFDDLAEAVEAWGRAEHWVRTGSLREGPTDDQDERIHATKRTAR